MTIFIAKAAELIAAWDNPAKHSDLKADIADAMADLLRQIAALGDWEGLTDEQIEDVALKDEFWFDSAPNANRFKWGDFARAIESAATLPLRARIAELEKIWDEQETLIIESGEKRIELQEQLAASQAREQELRGALKAVLKLIRLNAPELSGKVLGDADAAMAQPSDLTALHADRKATIERVRDSYSRPSNSGWANDGANIIEHMNKAAERAGRGEPI